ncbi:MAG TPA: protein kinase, partial [Candidatus Acidoferrales bacterium]|nr:protein kinase [Candidatus Acidoferrales bacterium]
MIRLELAPKTDSSPLHAGAPHSSTQNDRWGLAVTSSARPFAVDEQVGDYKILGTAGVGGMGIVYKALDLKLNRTVALKFLPNDLNLNSKDKERFLQEARTASGLDHTNIGVIHGLEQTSDGHTFIVMAYYEGLTLAERIRRGPIAPKEALGIMVQLAHGLIEAHEHSIIHRDVKPSNVIITRQGVAKIVDFGLARVAGGAATTLSAGPVGTLAYMSPEQVRSEPLDRRTDIWSLGVILQEMLTGKHPFERDNMSAVLLAILEQPPPVEGLDPALAAIVCRALAKDRVHRYNDCREMLADIEACKPVFDAHPTAPVPRDSRSSALNLRKALGHASSTRPLATPMDRAWRWAVELIAAILVVIVLTLLIPSARQRVATLLSRGGGEEKHIAVLPFDNIGHDPANEEISEGLMDSLTSKLSNLESSENGGQQSLWVVPASEVRRKKVEDPEAALREFGATLVVKGSVMRDASGVRLTVNLIRTKDVRQEGSLSLQNQSGDFAALQDQAVSGLARLMHVEVPATALRAAEGPAAPAAYESYLKALGYMQRYDKPGNLDRAIASLTSAVESDAQFALGYAGMAEAYRLKYQLDKNPRWTDMALADGNKATALNDSLPSAYVTLGRIHDALGKNDLALAEFDRALKLDSRNADALTGEAHSYEHAGRLADAEAAYKKAIALRPDYWDGYNSLGLFYDDQGRYDDAVKELQHAIELTPDNATAYSNLGAAYVDSSDPKNYPQAEAALKKSLELAPSYGAYANLGDLYLLQNRYAESAGVTEKALQMNDKDFIVWANLVAAYDGLKDEAKANTVVDREQVLLEQAAKSSPRDAAVQYRLGIVYARKKQGEKALACAQTALALSPDDAYTLTSVAEIYERLGDRKRALQYVEQGLQKGYPLQALQNDQFFKNLLAD